MHVGRTQVVVLTMCVVGMVMPVVVSMVVIVAAGQQQCADDIDDQADNGNPRGRAERDLGRLEKTHH